MIDDLLRTWKGGSEKKLPFFIKCLPIVISDFAVFVVNLCVSCWLKSYSTAKDKSLNIHRYFIVGYD
jgi:hypothetical protein